MSSTTSRAITRDDGKPYIAWHYLLRKQSDVTNALAAGRIFYSQTGEWLPDLDSIRSAFRRDVVVVSVSR